MLGWRSKDFSDLNRIKLVLDMLLEETSRAFSRTESIENVWRDLRINVGPSIVEVDAEGRAHGIVGEA